MPVGKRNPLFLTCPSLVTPTLHSQHIQHGPHNGPDGICVCTERQCPEATKPWGFTARVMAIMATGMSREGEKALDPAISHFSQGYDPQLSLVSLGQSKNQAECV